MKKAKLLIAIAAVSVVGIAAASVATANLTGGLNTVHVRADKLPERQEGGLLPGNALYLRLTEGGNWDSYGAKFAIAFNGTVFTDLMTFVEKTNQTNIYEIRVPEYAEGVESWNFVIAVRGFLDGIIDWDHAWTDNTKSGDIYLTDNNNLVTNIDPNPDNNDWGTSWTFQEYYSWQDRILAWADEDWVADADEWDSDTVCTLTDEYTYEQRLQVITTSWEASKARYEAIAGDDVKAAFSNFDWAIDDAPEQLKKLAERYDYLVRTYNLEDFAQRGI